MSLSDEPLLRLRALGKSFPGGIQAVSGARFALNDDLLALQRELHTTIIFVTHSVFESVYLSQRIAIMSARPGRVAGEIVIEAPEPRGPEFRVSSSFADQSRAVSAALRQAMQASAA